MAIELRYQDMVTFLSDETDSSAINIQFSEQPEGWALVVHCGSKPLVLRRKVGGIRFFRYLDTAYAHALDLLNDSGHWPADVVLGIYSRPGTSARRTSTPDQPSASA